MTCLMALRPVGDGSINVASSLLVRELGTLVNIGHRSSASFAAALNASPSGEPWLESIGFKDHWDSAADFSDQPVRFRSASVNKVPHDRTKLRNSRIYQPQLDTPYPAGGNHAR